MKRLEEREYETRAVAELPALLAEHTRVVAVAPTGAGKTVIAAMLIRRMEGKRVLWLAHRKELLEQAARALEEAGIPNSEIGILSGAKKANVDGRVLVAGIRMFDTRLVPEADLIVVDEAHHVAADSYAGIIFAQPETPVLGLTATPERLDGKPLGDVFNRLYIIAEALELVADGYIKAPAVYACIDQKRSRGLTRGIASSKGDWSPAKLESVMRTPKLMADIVTEWKRRADGLATLCFATTVEHAWDICKRFRAAGVTSEVVSWQTPTKEREAILERLEGGQTLVVVNVAVFPEGLDCPPVKCIIVARPTKSLVLHRQMLGRCMRPHGRRRPIVLDHAGNVWRHALPDQPIEWSLDGRVGRGGPCPNKKCVACEEMMPIGCRVCPHCGSEQPFEETELEAKRGELEIVRAEEAQRMARERVIRKLAEERGLPDEWVERALKEAS